MQTKLRRQNIDFFFIIIISYIIQHELKSMFAALGDRGSQLARGDRYY